jgi:hypothetical protein
LKLLDEILVLPRRISLALARHFLCYYNTAFMAENEKLVYLQILDKRRTPTVEIILRARIPEPKPMGKNLLDFILAQTDLIFIKGNNATVKKLQGVTKDGRVLMGSLEQIVTTSCRGNTMIKDGLVCWYAETLAEVNVTEGKPPVDIWAPVAGPTWLIQIELNPPKDDDDDDVKGNNMFSIFSISSLLSTCITVAGFLFFMMRRQ